MCCQEIIRFFDASPHCLTENTTVAVGDGKKFRIQAFSPEERFCRLLVDGGLIRADSIRKCDFWMRRCLKLENYFIEFKSGNSQDIRHSMEQIGSTIAEARSRKIPLPKNSISGFIIANKVPLAKNEIQILKEEFKKQYGTALVIKSRECTHPVR